jgi:hypothetical protein
VFGALREMGIDGSALDLRSVISEESSLPAEQNTAPVEVKRSVTTSPVRCGDCPLRRHSGPASGKKKDAGERAASGRDGQPAAFCSLHVFQEQKSVQGTSGVWPGCL